MLIARAPVRVSFFGGGTDLPAYYNRYGGAVLNSTIDKYVYVILNVSERNALQITSSDYRTFYRHPPNEPLLWDGDLSLPRAVLQHFGVEAGLTMFLASEVPPGTGLGSSSAVTVALIKAISATCNLRPSAKEIAEMACEIEIDKLSKPIGKQDQYAAAYGGFNWVTFSADEIKIEPMHIPQETLARLESNLLLMFTGQAHDSATILAKQRRSNQEQDPRVIEAHHGAKELAFRARECLQKGDLDKFGAMLDEAWQHKKQFAPGISNERIDRSYQLARQNGALGGKIAGAGGGGFLMLYCEDGATSRVETALMEEGLRSMDYHFECDGPRVLFNAGLRLR